MIFDCLAVPGNNRPGNFDSLITAEIERAKEFAENAQNSTASIAALRGMLISLGESPDLFIEDEEDADE